MFVFSPSFLIGSFLFSFPSPPLFQLYLRFFVFLSFFLIIHFLNVSTFILFFLLFSLFSFLFYILSFYCSILAFSSSSSCFSVFPSSFNLFSLRPPTHFLLLISSSLFRIASSSFPRFV